MKKNLFAILLLGAAWSHTAYGQCSITASGPTTVCEGSTVTLESNVTVPLQWYKDGQPINGATNNQYVATESGDYTMETTSPACTSNTIHITVSPLPLVSVTPSGPVSFCQGSSVTLTAAVTAPCPSTFQWRKNGIYVAGATNSSFVATEAGDYSVVSVNCNGCMGISNIVQVTLNPQPSLTVTASGPLEFCDGSSVTFTAVSNANATPVWYDGTIVAGPGYTYTTGVPGIIVARVTDPVTGCSATSAANTVTVNPIPMAPVATGNSPVCLGGTLELHAAGASAAQTFSWTGPNGFSAAIANPVISNVTAADSGSYMATVTELGCTSLPSAVHVDISCPVWPGDVNYDYMVNNDDALAIALAFAANGTIRPNATLNWIGQYSPDWAPPTTPVGATGADLKHADCNGDGTVNHDDTMAIHQNYSLTHQRGTAHTPKARVNGLPDLYFDMSGVTIMPGATVNIPILLGSAADPMNNILGLATQIKISGITLDAQMELSYPQSWLGTSSNTLRFAHDVTNNQLDWAYARIDHQNTSGSGALAMLTFTIPATAGGSSFTLFFDDAHMVKNNGDAVTGFNTVDATIEIPVSVPDIEHNIQNAVILPNPSSSSAMLTWNQQATGKTQIVVTDLTGKVLWNTAIAGAPGENRMILPAAQLASGMYLVQIQDARQVRQTLKWIRK